MNDLTNISELRNLRKMSQNSAVLDTDENNDTLPQKRQSGRSKKNSEDRARNALNFKLYDSELEVFKTIPGTTDAERLRYLLSNTLSFHQIIKRQVSELSKLIRLTYKRSKMITDPAQFESVSDESTKFRKKKKLITDFFDSYSQLEKLSDLYHIGFNDLRGFLDDDDLHKFTIAFNAKQMFELDMSHVYQ